MVAEKRRGARARIFARALLPGLVLGAATFAAPALGQPGQPARPAAPPQLPVPDERTALRLLWSTIAAVDHANRTGNYSVLRDLGSAGFQTSNNAAALAGIFTGIRSQNVDLSEALIVTPAWEIAPRMIRPGVMRMRGTFPLRPIAIAFDLLFAWEGGAWRLDGVAVQAQRAPPR